MAESVDVAVVGGGLAGLTAAALLAKNGMRVAVFEKHGKLGGYAQYFGQEPTFDAATHLVGGVNPGGWTRMALEEVGAWERLTMLPLDPVYQGVFPDHRYLAAADPARFQQELTALWPTEAPGISRFVADMEAIGRDYLKLADGPAASGPLADNADRTLADFLNAYTRNEELRAALSAWWIFAGLPPSRLSVLHYAMLWHTYHTQGSAAVKGGVRALTDALSAIITEAGGVVETRQQVERILRQRGRVTGVRVSDGREFTTRAVISTASPHDTFEELLAAEGQNAAGYPALRQGYVASISAMQVHLLVRGPLELPAHTTIRYTDYDADEVYLDLQRAEPDFSGLVVTHLNREDPDRCPPDRNMLSLFTLAPYGRSDNWNAPFETRRGPGYRTLEEYASYKGDLGDQLIAEAEEIIPDLSERVEARKVATPLTLERYTFNTGGAAFGWSNIPQQSGAHRPGPETPFQGLYMAGHWTFPGGSIAGALTSGRIAAKTILLRG